MRPQTYTTGLLLGSTSLAAAAELVPRIRGFEEKTGSLESRTFNLTSHYAVGQSMYQDINNGGPLGALLCPDGVCLDVCTLSVKTAMRATLATSHAKNFPNMIFQILVY